MSKIQAVVAATDFSADSGRAAQRAAVICNEHSARLQVVHVLRTDILGELRPHLADAKGVERRVAEESQHHLQEIGSALQALAGVQAETVVRTGRVIDEILAAADPANLLVLGARGARVIQEALLGTTAERLLRRSRRPMLVVKQEPTSRYARVFVPVDFSTQSIGALEFAQHLAPSAQIQIFHAYECPYEGKLRWADVPEEAIEEVRLEFRQQALANMENLVDKWVSDPTRVTTTLEYGNPKFLVPARARDNHADLIVLGKHGRSAAEELLLGGVTRHVLGRATCDVAVVPDWPRL